MSSVGMPLTYILKMFKAHFKVQQWHWRDKSNPRAASLTWKLGVDDELEDIGNDKFKLNNSKTSMENMFERSA